MLQATCFTSETRHWRVIVTTVSLLCLNSLPCCSALKNSIKPYASSHYLSKLASNRNPYHFDKEWSTRGGALQTTTSAGPSRKQASTRATTSVSKPHPATIKLAMWAIFGIAVSVLGFQHRQAMAALFNKKKLQDTTLHLLEQIEKKGWRGVATYIVGLALWEFAGFSTIPVETAAGMAFGWERGLAASGAGKMLGAVAAFSLGRSVLADWVRSRLGDNSILQLIDGSVAAHPLKVSFLLKYSCFPEMIKNFGSATLKPIRLWMFILATAVHGWSFTMLWTYLGLDTAKRLKNEAMPPDRVLHAALVAAMLVGIVISPLLMAWWVRDMRNQAKLKQHGSR